MGIYNIKEDLERVYKKMLENFIDNKIRHNK